MTIGELSFAISHTVDFCAAKMETIHSKDGRKSTYL